MRYAIISDIHANSDALERVIEDAQSQEVESFICLGDIVGYGPEPQTALSRIRELCDITLAGNHDDAVSSRGNAEDFINLAGDAVIRHRDALSQDGLDWLKSLPWECEIEGAIAAHGDLCDPKKFYYIENEEDARANFNASSSRLIFVGHTHVPSIFLTGRSGAIYNVEPQDFTIEEGKRYIVNPGSVGYPREKDGQCFSSYVIYDSVEETVSFRFIPFSVSSVMQRGKTPKRIKKSILAIAATLIAVITTTLTICIAPAKVIDIDPELIIEKREITSLKSTDKLRINLYIEKKSPNVQVTITYFDNNKTKLQAESFTVKDSRTRAEKIPKNATSAEIVIQKYSKDAEIKIKSFNPGVSAK